MSDIALAIQYSEDTLTLLPATHPYRSTILASMWRHLSRALVGRYLDQGRRSDLEDASLYIQDALAVTPKSHSYHPGVINDMAHISYLRYSDTGDTEVLERAIVHGLDAVACASDGHVEDLSALLRLMVYLLARHDEKHDHRDLTGVIGMAARALLLVYSDSPAHPYVTHNLAYALYARYTESDIRSDLDLSIGFGQDGISHLPVGHPHRPTLNLLASAFKSRYIASKRGSDLDDAIKYGQEVLTLSATSEAKRSTALTTLAHCLTSRYEARAEHSDLKRASRY